MSVTLRKDDDIVREMGFRRAYELVWEREAEYRRNRAMERLIRISPLTTDPDRNECAARGERGEG